MKLSPWPGLLRVFSGLVLFLFAAAWLSAFAHYFPHWYCADRYVPAEFEVTKFDDRPPRGARGRVVEGVIRPGGEKVTAGEHALDVARFVPPVHAAGRQVPVPEEIVGQRIPVRYWPDHASGVEFWHPPQIVAPDPVSGERVARFAVLFFLFGAASIYCFRHGYRRLGLSAAAG